MAIDILIINPYDASTQFLTNIHIGLKAHFNDRLQYFEIKLNEGHHQECLDRIKHLSNDSLIIFMGHGSSIALHGSKGDEFSPNVGWEEIAEFPELYFYKESFISKSNIEVFKTKKVFCLSCNSNKEIANQAFENGVKTFFGFGNIPSSKEEFIIEGETLADDDLVSKMKSELSFVITTSLTYCMLKGFSFKKLKNVIEFSINKKIAEYLIENKDYDGRYILANYLFRLKKGMMIFGDKDAKLIE